MRLIHNLTFRLVNELEPSTPYLPGIYRVILDEPIVGKTVAVLIQSDEQPARRKGGRPKKKQSAHHRKKPPPPLVGDLIWMEKDELIRLHEERLLAPIDIEREAVRYTLNLSEKSKADHERRLRAMAGFLDMEKLEERILVHAGLSGLVKEAMHAANVSRSFVYKQWSLLCHYGIDEKSLLPRRDRCGGRGQIRRCDPAGRKKAGRKTLTQRIERAYGRHLDSVQPGMSSEWAAAIRAADKQIAEPKPSWPTRCNLILSSAFIARGKEVNGKIELVKPELGGYPNDSQIKRVLTFEKSKLEQLIESTTTAHFKRALRGLSARNWQGVSGPGHTWAIDSTVGDIYLRSTVDQSWIVGRPIVYVIVDVWSTAVVGFHVCLTGPSWDTAKISLFNSTCDPALLGELWGYQPILALAPAPTMCYQLLCDRGEYLSKAHRMTARKLIPLTSYTPPYRGDLKGLVEVIHRIEKDAQFLFVPGAMNYRRQELELRRIDPNACVMTVRDYVQYLHLLFAEYNLTADRRHRLDAHMAAAGVIASPAGLWRWGHCTGIGVSRHVEAADLVTGLLPSSTAHVGRSSVRFARCDYTSSEVKAAQWTALARNFRGWDLPINHYPGSMSRIWTPNIGGSGLVRLSLSDESKASPALTYDDYLDSLAYEAMHQPEEKHYKKMLQLDFLKLTRELIKRSTQQTQEAIARASGTKPTYTEARALEVASTQQNPSESATKEKERDEALTAHQAMMDSLLRGIDDREDDHA